MLRLVPCLAASTFVALFATFAAATPAQLEADFEALRRLSVDYTAFGTVCEEVARLRLAETYPLATHDIDVGVEYRLDERSIGELDVVVIRKRDRKAVLVSEVKCRSSLAHAARLARQQLERFQSTLATGRRITFVARDPRCATTRVQQFDDATSYVITSQNGGELVGFDRTIGLELEEATALRDRLMACQASGACPLPP